MAWRRRNFLQVLGLTCGVIGTAQFIDSSSFRRSAQALSKFQGRKFALLIGIDHYGSGYDLEGCQEDLKIQQYLLQSRFSFDPNNITVLKNDRASAKHILKIFREDFAQTLQKDDLLFIHFSGYGTLIKGNSGTTVPAVVVLDDEGPQAIALSTLRQLTQQLNPAQAILVLDTSFDANRPTLSPYWQGRSYPPGYSQPRLGSLPIDDDLEKQSIKRQSIIELWAAKKGVTPEIPLNGTKVGLFTALLGECLTLEPTLSLAYAQRSLQATMPLNEQLGATAFVATTSKKPLYGELPTQTAAGVGTVQSQSQTNLSLYLGGINPEILQAIAPGSEYRVEIDDEQPVVLQLLSKQGVFAQAKRNASIPQAIAPGTILQESVRLLPRNLLLKIALAKTLQRIERVDATSAFASLEQVEVVGNGSEWADYIFGGESQLATISGEAISRGASTKNEPSRAIKASIMSLEDRFDQLLALKWLRLLINDTSSQLPLQFSMQFSTKSNTPLPKKVIPVGNENKRQQLSPIPSFSSGESIPFQLKNTGSESLYYLGFAQNPEKDIFLLTPTVGLPPLAPGATADLELAALKPLGAWQTYWMFSDRPFSKFRELAVVKLGESITLPRQLILPMELLAALLQDLHLAPSGGSDSNRDYYRLCTRHWAGLHLEYVVIDSA